MTMSTEAAAGLHAAVRWNPYGARILLGVLQQFPAHVRHKPDPYGPLHLILNEVELLAWTDGEPTPIDGKPLPKEALTRFEAFGSEWRQRRFTKHELAEAIAAALAGMAPDGDGEGLVS